MRRPGPGRAGLASALLAVASCLACAAGPPGSEPAETGPGGSATPSHAADARRLRESMRELDGLRRLRLPQELDPDREQGLRREEAARSARAIAEAAERVGRHPPGDLSPEDQEVYRSLAEALRAQAAAIAAEAEHLDPAALARRLAGLDATCAACHERFERGPGRLGGPAPEADPGPAGLARGTASG